MINVILVGFIGSILMVRQNPFLSYSNKILYFDFFSKAKTIYCYIPYVLQLNNFLLKLINFTFKYLCFLFNYVFTIKIIICSKMYLIEDIGYIKVINEKLKILPL